VKPSRPPIEPKGTSFQNFDRLFRAVISVSKSAIEKEEAKVKRRKAHKKKRSE